MNELLATASFSRIDDNIDDTEFNINKAMMVRNYEEESQQQQQQQEEVVWQDQSSSSHHLQQQHQQRPLVGGVLLLPSNANGEEPVAPLVVDDDEDSENNDIEEEEEEEEEENDIMEIKEFITHDIVEIEEVVITNEQLSIVSKNNELTTAPQDNYNKKIDNESHPDVVTKQQQQETEGTTNPTSSTACEEILEDEETSNFLAEAEAANTNSSNNKHISEPNSLMIDTAEELEEEDIVEVEDHTRTTDKVITCPNNNNNNEESIIGGEILFRRNEGRLTQQYGVWDAISWMSYSGSRKVVFCNKHIYRVSEIDTSTTKPSNLFQSFLWKTEIPKKQYEPRAVVIYEHPTVILILRRPMNLEELYHVFDLPPEDDIITLIGEDNGNNNKALEKYWIVESAIDPSTAKLRLSSLTTITSVMGQDDKNTTATDNDDNRERSCMEIITPTETIVLSAVTTDRSNDNKSDPTFRDTEAYQETLAVEKSITKALYAAHPLNSYGGGNSLDSSWKHQIVIGSLHSIVLSGNVKALSASIEYAKKHLVREKMDSNNNNNNHLILSHILDAKDEDGFTPLYYACKNKMHSIAQCLVNEGANVLSRHEPGNGSLLHVAARYLDDKMISVLLSVSSSHPSSRLDVNTLDAEYRTPMYVAATEGSVLGNGTNPLVLGSCIQMLRKFGGRMTITGTPKMNRHPVSVLSSLLLPEYLYTTIQNLPFRYPLSGPLDNYKIKPMGSSLSAIYHYPVHFTILALRTNLSRILPVAVDNDNKLVLRCLRILLEHGFEPNERLECTHVSEIGSDEIQPFFGFAPIQLLAVVAIELESLKEKMDSSIFAKKSALIKDVAVFLIQNGARISLDPPPPIRKRKNTIRGSMDGTTRTVEILPLKIDSDKQVLALLEVDNKEKGLNKARQEWTDTKKVEVYINVDLLDNYTTIDDSDSPGGTDSQSCAICWTVFGTIMNRRHKCRVTGRFVCDDCSSKRLVVGGTEHRISDGQFLLFRGGEYKRDTVPKGVPAVATSNQTTRNSISTPGSSSSSIVHPKLGNQDSVNRESLFGTILDRATSYVMGDDEGLSSTTTAGLVATLDQTRDALNQRGERLNTLSDKSAQLVDASADFAKMAKQLNQQSEGGFFW